MIALFSVGGCARSSFGSSLGPNLRPILFMSNTRQPPLSEPEIAARARELWRIAGNPPGRDLEFWLAAEAELKRDREVTATAADNQPVPQYEPRKQPAPKRRKP